MYRSNRVTPIYTLLNFTCLLLADDLKLELERYWTSSDLTDLQFKQEVERFGLYLKRRISTGCFKSPFLEEVLDFELAMNELQFIPRRSISRQIRCARTGRDPGPFQLNPLIRVVRFWHEPFELLDSLRKERVPLEVLPRREFIIVLDASQEQIDMRCLDAAHGNILLRFLSDGVSQQHSDAFAKLVSEGLLIPKLPDRE